MGVWRLWDGYRNGKGEDSGKRTKGVGSVNRPLGGKVRFSEKSLDRWRGRGEI